MRDHSHHIELSRDEAVEQILARCPFCAEAATAKAGKKGRMAAPKRPVEQIALSDAFGRVLARDMRARMDIPNVLTCRMDSVAVHWSSFENLAEGEVPDTSAWVRGVDWEFANTGVAMPAGFDTAIVIEHVTVSEDEQHIEVHAAPSKQFAGTKPAGANTKRYDVVAKAGSVITPDVAAIIAGAGRSVVPVLAKPRVAFIPTGNELIPPNVPYSDSVADKYAGAGRTFESNSLVVKGKIEAWGGTYVPFDIVPDDYHAIKCTIQRAVQVADIVVLNAGSSKGSDDWSVEVLEEMGDVICHQTNHGPGHHSSYAIVDGVPIVGISGPSGGASFTLNFYLKPLMKAYLGLDPTPERIPARLVAPFAANRFKKPEPGTLPGESRPPEAAEPGDAFYSIRFLTVAMNDEGVFTATPVPGHPGSAATQHANAYCMIPSGVGIEPPEVGSTILVEMR